MFAREVVLQLKPNVVKEFPVTFEKEILPLLRKQKGFLDELLLVTPEKGNWKRSACGRPRSMRRPTIANCIHRSKRSWRGSLRASRW